MGLRKKSRFCLDGDDMEEGVNDRLGPGEMSWFVQVFLDGMDGFQHSGGHDECDRKEKRTGRACNHDGG